MTKLYEYVYPTCVVAARKAAPRLGEEYDLVEADEFIHSKIEAMRGFIFPKHLDIMYDITLQPTWSIDCLLPTLLLLLPFFHLYRCFYSLLCHLQYHSILIFLTLKMIE